MNKFRMKIVLDVSLPDEEVFDDATTEILADYIKEAVHDYSDCEFHSIEVEKRA